MRCASAAVLGIRFVGYPYSSIMEQTLTNQNDFIKGLPKAELHLHIERSFLSHEEGRLHLDAIDAYVAACEQ